MLCETRTLFNKTHDLAVINLSSQAVFQKIRRASSIKGNNLIRLVVINGNEYTYRISSCLQKLILFVIPFLCFLFTNVFFFFWKRGVL